jgi:phosphatidylinositol-3-phosphatase
VADRKDDQVPDPAGRATCTECGNPLAPDQRYCLSCGARRGRLPGAVASTLGAVAAKGKGIAAAAGAKGSKPKGDGDGEKGGWSWMPSPPAIAIAVIGMLALGVGLGSAMSEVASSAPISTLILEYPHHAAAAAPEEPEEEPVEEAHEEETFAEVPEEPAPELIEEPLPEEVIPSLPEEAIEEPQPEGEEPNPLKESIEATEREQKEREEEEAAEKLPEIKHAFLIVLGENSYESTYGPTAEAPYLSRVLPGKGELLPNYYGVTGGVLANEIALLSGQGPTAETLVDCPNYTTISPGTVSETAEQVEGSGCVYGKEVKSLPTQLEEEGLTWRAYVEDMENGGAIGQPFRCRKPTLGGPDSEIPGPGDQYATWRNPVVYFSAIAESREECEKHDVGYELLTHDLQYKKATPALSLIFPDACHSGGETECEPDAPKGAQGITEELKTLVPAIMASPAYEEGGMILITSAQAPQAGENADPSGCCLAPSYPNLVAAGIQPAPTTAPSTSAPKTSTSQTSTTEAAAELEEEAEPTRYTEESVVETGGGGKVGLLMISPYVEAGKVEEFEYANHFTLLKSLEKMFGVEPLGYATEAEMPTLSPSLFRSAEEVEKEVEEKKAKEKSAAKKSKGKGAGKPTAFALERAFSRLLRSPGGSPGPAARRRGTS